MKLKFRVSTQEFLNLCKEMSDFLATHKNKTGFKRFMINNQVKEEGVFTFDLNVQEGYDHEISKWTDGAVTTIEIGTKKRCCWECVKREGEKWIKQELGDKK